MSAQSAGAAAVCELSDRLFTARWFVLFGILNGGL